MKYFYDPDNGRVFNARNETIAFCDSMSIQEAKDFLITSMQLEADAELESASVETPRDEKE